VQSVYAEANEEGTVTWAEAISDHGTEEEKYYLPRPGGGTFLVGDA